MSDSGDALPELRASDAEREQAAEVLRVAASEGRLVYSFMGGNEIRVPHGVNVQVSEFALMGGNDVQIGDEIAPAGGPTIHIRMVAVMGGSSLRRGRKLSRRERRELKEAERRERELGQGSSSSGELEP
jgi:hypothetical protein